ncbi:hypothetical protein ITJ55_07920 [Frigoribacterium sp. VKM Ac-1396]|uniref:hypothetical protein n=1 Tax=Frigoribacterium sp. VKM Ac-1396 TaxID=2783821 RepID=UPI001889DDC1|nr:hypothetical protein [Frigoribacterium sp. VKM Ac-1396]MBF4600735.1 hypothetical protein [Frigoribacterium sp. VKM Ac-1396]
MGDRRVLCLVVLGLALLTACSTGTTGPHDADDGLSLEETGTVATELIDGLQAQVDPTLVASVETQEDGAAAIGGSADDADGSIQEWQVLRYVNLVPDAPQLEIAESVIDARVADGWTVGLDRETSNAGGRWVTLTSDEDRYDGFELTVQAGDDGASPGQNYVLLGVVGPTVDETPTVRSTTSIEETGRRADDLVDRVVALLDPAVVESVEVFEDGDAGVAGTPNDPDSSIRQWTVAQSVVLVPGASRDATTAALVDALIADGFTVFEDDTTPSGSRRIVTGPGEGADEPYTVTLRGGPDSSVNRLIDVQVNGPVVETASVD